MKKLLLALVLPFALCFTAPAFNVAKAEEEIVETSEVVETSETIETSEISESSETAEPVVETSEDESEKISKFEFTQFVEKVKQILSENFSVDLLLKIIAIAVDVSLVIALLVVVSKNRKLSVQNQIAFRKDVLAQDEKTRKEIKEEIEKIENEYNTIIKAIVLSQDKTADGKVALLDLVANAKATKKEVIEKAIEVKEKVVEDKKQKEKVIEKVKEDYIPID